MFGPVEGRKDEIPSRLFVILGMAIRRFPAYCVFAGAGDGRLSSEPIPI
jgi:hypothetical protein